MNSYMKEKIHRVLKVRFDARNVEVKKSFEALDSSKECYLDETTLTYLVEHFPSLEINQSTLELELVRTQKDFPLELPISESRCRDLMKLVAP